jgi:hypothetical protein
MVVALIDHDPRPPWARQVHRLVEGLYGRVFWLIASVGLAPAFIVLLQVQGRRSGKLHSTDSCAGTTMGSDIWSQF